MIRRPPRSTQSRSSAASDVYKRQLDFDVLVPGHPPLSGTKADVQLLREYLEDSRAAFVAARDHGVEPDSEAMAAELDEALAAKYGQVCAYANSVPVMAMAWARELADEAYPPVTHSR